MDNAMMMPCDQVISKLWEYLDGALDEARAGKIREHLEMCARCLPQYNFELAFLALLKRNSRQPVPASLQRKVFEALLESSASDPNAQLLRKSSFFNRLGQAWRTFRGRRN
ncbi:MAG: zf-HC2 domain-containing protein [Gemmatimonadaceae bacterium]|nr:zf-HC2 domain-containing protein [Gemmatimonadaceae bacterium]